LETKQQMDNLAYISAKEIARLVRAREASPVEIVDYFIDRIREPNESLNAFVFLDAEGARERARVAEKALYSGETLGPLHGVPSALKDLWDYRPGWINTLGGVRSLSQHRCDEYSVFAQRVERSGAIMLGGTNAPTFGFRGTCDNFLFGPTKTPFDLSRNSGGSSGGSAAAVADGLVPFAQGTDGGGSIRIPAAWCGVYGYKPSFGRVPIVSRPNAFGATAPFIFEGPITRTVEDAALLLGVLAGYDPRDPYALDEPWNFTLPAEPKLNQWRIAYARKFGDFPVEADVLSTIDNAVRAFEEAGATVDKVDIQFRHSQAELVEAWCRLISVDNLRQSDLLKTKGIDLLGRDANDLPPELSERLQKAQSITAAEYLRDKEICSQVYEAIQSVFAQYDLIVTPTLACLPVLNSQNGNILGPQSVNDVPVNPLLGWCLTYPVNFSGHPAASIPAGLAFGSLPLGMQIIGRRYADRDVLTASAAFERARPWLNTYQICDSRPLGDS
jgi:amidase